MGLDALNRAIHMAAVAQLRHAHSEGHVYFDRKVAEGKTKKEPLRSLKRRLSDAVYRQLLQDAARSGAREDRRERLISLRDGSTP